MNAAEFSALPDVQRMSATAVAYKVLGTLAPDVVENASLFGGKLLLCAGLGEQGFAYSLAMSIAGGTFVGIEPRPQRLKEALRDGVCDYMVNSLDEALRVLKNEIRKKTPVSVGLLGDIATILNEAVERGVQPDYVVAGNSSSNAAGFDVFEQRGAVPVMQNSLPSEPTLTVASAALPATLKVFERVVASVLVGQPAFWSKWAESSPRYFRRTTPPKRSALLDRIQIVELERLLAQQTLSGDMLLGIQSEVDGNWRLDDFVATDGAA
jgi:hypothetical protein